MIKKYRCQNIVGTDLLTTLTRQTTLSQPLEEIRKSTIGTNTIVSLVSLVTASVLTVFNHYSSFFVESWYRVWSWQIFCRPWSFYHQGSYTFVRAKHYIFRGVS